MQLSKKIIVSTMVGNIAEWYEFYIYGMFAAPIIAKLFLPQDSAFIALLYAYTAFAVGFLMRPIGAIILGYFGDKYGRKKNTGLITLINGHTYHINGNTPHLCYHWHFGAIVINDYPNFTRASSRRRNWWCNFFYIGALSHK